MKIFFFSLLRCKKLKLALWLVETKKIHIKCVIDNCIYMATVD